MAKLLNSAPPFFDEDLEDVTLTGGNYSEYAFPSITDYDGDPYSITSSMGEAIIFTNLTQGKLLFNPPLSAARDTPYIIKIKLTD